jgi:signal transduction histidine kinase
MDSVDSRISHEDTLGMGRPAQNLHDLAHDLRSPLASIRATAEAALLDPALAPETRQILDKIIAKVDRLAKTTEKLI